jgi:hypothetical protein
VVGAGGATQVLLPSLAVDELTALQASAQVLRNALAALP